MIGVFRVDIFLVMVVFNVNFARAFNQVYANQVSHYSDLFYSSGIVGMCVQHFPIR